MTRRRWLRSELVRLVALVAALAVVTGAWLAGQRYYYCAPMERIALHECCASHDHDDVDLDEHAAIGELPHRCCEERLFDAGDRGATAAPPAVPPAPALPVIAVLAILEPPSELATARTSHESRAGPPQASPLAWRTTIDVSLT